MSKTYIELVPRSGDSLTQEMAQIDALGIPCDGFNLPELKQGKTTFLTPEEMMLLRRDGYISAEKDLVLHMRTRERTTAQTITRMTDAFGHGVTSVLLVTGDAHEHGAEPTHAHDVLAAIPKKIPDGGVAVAADLYHPAWGRWEQKIPSLARGIADTVFTQPIFHTNTLQEVNDRAGKHFTKENIFAGITWITTEKSRTYWRDRNSVPEKFLPAGASDDTIRRNSLAQATDVLRAARAEDLSTYVMLMRGTMDDLRTVFSRAENIREH